MCCWLQVLSMLLKHLIRICSAGKVGTLASWLKAFPAGDCTENTRSTAHLQHNCLLHISLNQHNKAEANNCSMRQFLVDTCGCAMPRKLSEYYAVSCTTLIRSPFLLTASALKCINHHQTDLRYSCFVSELQLLLLMEDRLREIEPVQ